ncbi:hypothetical protein C0J52_02082 [Blattella germanica]|nr:hypothetical protein C0J52_02082 [Blattella germanica]
MEELLDLHLITKADIIQFFLFRNNAPRRYLAKLRGFLSRIVCFIKHKQYLDYKSKESSGIGLEFVT